MDTPGRVCYILKTMAFQKSTKKFEKDSLILKEGADSGNEILFLTKGTAVVEMKGAVVGTVRAGEWFGELAAILHSHRTADVRAVTPCEVLSFKGIEDASLYEGMSKDPKMIRKLIEQLCFRLVETSQRSAKEGGDLSGQAMRYRRAISATVFVLDMLVEKYKSKVMEQTLEQLRTLSGVNTGQISDADARFFPGTSPGIFGS